MSKKGDKTPGPPSSAAPGAGGNNAADAPNTTTLTSDMPLFDDEWTAWIGAVLPDPSDPTDPATTQSLLTSLHETIASGLRRKFTLISKTSILEWINESLKSSDLAKEAKAAMDALPRGADLPDALMVKLLRQAVMNARIECLEARKAAQLAAQQAAQAEAEAASAAGGKKKEEKAPTAPGTAAAGAGAGAGGKAGGDAASPKSAAPKKGAGGKEQAADKAARPETAAAAGDAGAPKAKGKLRDRALPKVKVTPLDDEPIDGPDTYILLWTFSSPTLLEALALDTSFPLHAVTTLSQARPATSTAGAPLSAPMRDIQSRVFLTQPESPVMFTTVCTGSAAVDVTAVFGLLAKQWYALLTDRREYAAFYAKQRVVTVPVVKELGASGNMSSSHGDAEIGEIVAAIKEIVNQVAGPVVDPNTKVSERGTFKLHEPAHLVHSRATSLLRLLPTPPTSASPESDWRLLQLATRTGLSLETAAFYLDVMQFEHILGGTQDLSHYTWVEHIQTPSAIQALDTLLCSATTPANIRYQLRGSRLLVATKAATEVESATYAPPKRLGLGSWFHKKSTAELPLSFGYVYDESNPSAIAAAITPVGERGYGVRKSMPTRDVVVYELPGDAVCTLVPATGEVVLTFAHGNSFEFRRGGSGEADKHGGGQYTTKNGYMCTVNDQGVHVRHPAQGSGSWRCILGASGDHVVVSQPAEAADQQRVAYLKVNGTTGSKTAGGEWTWVTCDGTDPKVGCLHESDPVALRDMWRRDDGVNATRFRDGSWMAKHVDGTVMRTRTGKSPGWGCLVPGLGEVEGGSGNGQEVVVYDLQGYRVTFGDKLVIRRPTGHVVTVEQGRTCIATAGSTIDLVSGSIAQENSDSVHEMNQGVIVSEIKCGNVMPSLLSAAPLVSRTATSPNLIVLQPSQVPGHASHMCLRTDSSVQHELLRAVNDHELRVHITEESVVNTSQQQQQQQQHAVVAVNLVVYHLPTQSVHCRQLLRFPPLTHSGRQAVLAAWTDIQQMTGPPHAVTESTPDMNLSSASATLTASAPSAPSLSESDLFHRFLSTPERHLLLSRPNRPKPMTTTSSSSCSNADFDNGPGFQSPTMNLSDPGSTTNGPLTAGRTQHLFARGSVSAMRQHLVPVRKPIPSPNQIPVRLDAALKSVKTDLVPYFESPEGRAALAELAKTREREESKPRRPHSPLDVTSRPLYSSGPPIDLTEDLLADLDPLADLQRVRAGQACSTPNPFTRGPKLPPRPNRASSLRTSRVADVAAGLSGKRQCFKSLGLPGDRGGNGAAGYVYGRQAGTGLSATSIEGIADAAATLATAAAAPAGSAGLVFAPPVVRAVGGKHKNKGDIQEQSTANEWRGRGESTGQLAAPSRLDVL